MMCLMDRDWARFGRLVEAARRHRGWTQEDLVQEAGVGLSTVQSIERGRRDKPQILPTHRIVAHTLGWADGSIEAVLAGGDPTTVDQQNATPSASPEPPSRIEVGVDALLDDLTARVREALLGGTVADATAIDMGPEDDGEVVIIWKRGEKRDLTPEQQRDLRRRWGKLQHAARDILADGEEQEEQ